MLGIISDYIVTCVVSLGDIHSLGDEEVEVVRDDTLSDLQPSKQNYH